MSRHLPHSLDDLPLQHRLEVQKQLRAGEPTVASVGGESAAPRTIARPPISTDEQGLNKTERAFYEWLKCQGFLWIGVQNMTIKLAFDTRYTPDFVSYDGMEGPARVTFWEVKGHWEDDARVKIKVAARMFPWARFTAVQRIKGEWKFEEIKP